MLLPLVSVTGIGVLVGLIAGMSSGRVGRGVAQGVVGAWVGFALGGLVGLALDVISGDGLWLGAIGHTAALAAAMLGFVARPLNRMESPTMANQTRV